MAFFGRGRNRPNGRRRAGGTTPGVASEAVAPAYEGPGLTAAQRQDIIAMAQEELPELTEKVDKSVQSLRKIASSSTSSD